MLHFPSQLGVSRLASLLVGEQTQLWFRNKPGPWTGLWRGLSGGQSCGTEPITCGIWGCLQVGSIWIELKCRTHSWCQRIAWCGKKSTYLTTRSVLCALWLFSHSITSDSLWPHGTAACQASLSFTISVSPRVCSNSCSLCQWCYSIISSSVAPSPPALNISQHQGLFQCVSSSHQVAKVLELQLQHQSFQWIFRVNFLTILIFLLSKWLSGVFSSTTVQKHQFFGAQPSLWSNSLIHTWLLEKPQLWLYRPLLAKWCLCFLICFLGLL